MPRLFDLLSDSTQKGFIDERKKNKQPVRPQQKSAQATTHKPAPVPTQTTVHTTTQATAPEKVSVPLRPKVIAVPDFVAIDVETTGLDFKSDRIIEIGAVKFRKGVVAEEFSSFVQPGIPIPEAITELTGITDADVASAPAFSEIAQKLLDFIGDTPLCGHQIEFDATFLKEELKRLDKPATENQLLDTALLSRVLLPFRERFSLKNVCKVFGVTLDNAHRALHDARASGEVALKLIPTINDLPLEVRQTIAACAPSSLFKHFVFQSIGSARAQVAIEFSKEKPLQRLAYPDEYQTVDREAVNDVFIKGGTLSSLIDGFTPRAQQQQMARGITDALNTNSLYIAEAGTGTGKSLAYLVPSAFWALQNNCRVIIATRTRNLQDQLVEKDLPVVREVTGGKLKSAVLKGRSNYLCQQRFRELLVGKSGHLSPRERFAILPLIVWSTQTTTGDIEEQNQFNPKWFAKIWNIISAEHHECNNRKCHFYASCFFQRARNKALGSHIVIINHALFFSDICAETSFLGIGGPIVFDEAHHLEAGGHRFLRAELDTHRMNLYSEIINNLVTKIGALKEEKNIYECGKELKTSLKNIRKVNVDFSGALTAWAKKTFTASADYQAAYDSEHFKAMPETELFMQAITDVYERVSVLRQSIQAHTENEKFESLALEAQACIEQTSQLRADFLYLTSASTEEHVFWVEGNYDKGWTKLCGVPLDVGSLLGGMWERCNGAVIFTSATLSIAQSVDYFKQGTGINCHEERTAVDLFKSPFSPRQAIGCVMRTAPDVDTPNFAQYVAEALAALHGRFSKNMLVLFTSNSMLSAVCQALKAIPSINSAQILAQGVSGSRQLILDEFKKGSGMILLGTDSFWEGVDVPGEACEMVVIPRLPFPVPTHPLTAAIAQRMQEKTGESFFSYAIPEAVIRFRQGAGRLIRTATDRGALVVLDNRMVSRGYGKQFSRSLETTFTAYDDVQSMADAIDTFFSSDFTDDTGAVETTYVPMEDA